MILKGFSIFSQLLTSLTRRLDSMEVDLLARSDSVANPIAKDLITPPGKTLSIKV